MQIILMVIWSFIVRAIPLKRIFAGVVFTVVIVGATTVINDYNNATQEQRGGVISIGGK
jgi:hypothetical protein